MGNVHEFFNNIDWGAVGHAASAVALLGLVSCVFSFLFIAVMTGGTGEDRLSRYNYEEYTRQLTEAIRQADTRLIYMTCYPEADDIDPHWYSEAVNLRRDATRLLHKHSKRLDRYTSSGQLTFASDVRRQRDDVARHLGLLTTHIERFENRKVDNHA